jgi:hypothetical protein
VQWRHFVAAQWEACAHFAGRRRTRHRVRARCDHRARGAPLQLRRRRPPRARAGRRAEREAAHLQRVLRTADVHARDAVPYETRCRAGVPFGDLLFRFDFGVLGVEVCEDGWSPDGPLRRRAYSGAELMVNVSASPYRLGAQSHPARDALHALGRQSVCPGLCQRGRRAGRTHLRRRRVRVSERPHRARGHRFRQGFDAVTVDLDRTARLRAENTTWREDALDFDRAGRRVRIIDVEAGPERDGLAFPVPPGASFFLPAPAGAPRTSRARAPCIAKSSSTPSALGVGDYFEKNRFKCIGIALSGGRDSLLALLIVRRYIERRFGAERADAQCEALVRAFYMPTRYSSDTTRSGRRDHLSGTLRPVPAFCPSRRRSSANSRPAGRCFARTSPSRRSRSRTSRPGCAASACGTGPTAPVVCSCRRAT